MRKVFFVCLCVLSGFSTTLHSEPGISEPGIYRDEMRVLRGFSKAFRKISDAIPVTASLDSYTVSIQLKETTNNLFSLLFGMDNLVHVAVAEKAVNAPQELRAFTRNKTEHFFRYIKNIVEAERNLIRSFLAIEKKNDTFHHTLVGEMKEFKGFLDFLVNTKFPKVEKALEKHAW